MLSDSRVFQNGFYYPDLTHIFILNAPQYISHFPQKNFTETESFFASYMFKMFHTPEKYQLENLSTRLLN